MTIYTINDSSKITYFDYKKYNNTVQKYKIYNNIEIQFKVSK